MKRAMRVEPLTQEHDCIGEFHVATKSNLYTHEKNNYNICSFSVCTKCL